MTKLKVLVGCEESQAVCIEFRKRGHEAYSCDLQECSGGHPEWHLQMDVFKAIAGGMLVTQSGELAQIDKWDFIGLHPVCTKMTLSGNAHYAPGKPKHQERLDAVEWTISLWKFACKKSNMVYMENPMGAMNGDNRLPIPQVIQPYYFGDPHQKTTCLWLNGLPKLFHAKQTDLFNNKITHTNKGEFWEFISKKGKKKSFSKWYVEALRLSPKERTKARSKTFRGIAEAMATQWSEYLK